jgi:hypothetical protein
MLGNGLSSGGPSIQSPQSTSTPPNPATTQTRVSPIHQETDGDEGAVKII